MKKLLAIAVVLSTILSLCSCGAIFGTKKDDELKEYDGPEIKEFFFRTISYWGGDRSTYILDFEKNEYTKGRYSPYGVSTPTYVAATFTDEQEKILIDACYTYGLFGLDGWYEDKAMDGGEWNFAVRYADGTERRSTGINEAPEEIFEKCAPYFFDTCGEGYLTYYYPGYDPSAWNVGQFFVYLLYEQDGEQYKEYLVTNLIDAKWDNYESFGNDLYKIVYYNELNCKLYQNMDYRIRIGNQNKADRPEICLFIVKNYDFNKELTSETLITRKLAYKDEMFEIDLEKDKIYTIEAYYPNGYYHKYAFSTKTVD